VQLPLLQQSLSNAVHTYLSTLSIPGLTTIETTIDKILAHKRSLPRFCERTITTIKNRWYSSRYVSGYICPNKSGLRGQAATHAWVEIYLPTQGWRGIDPTNNIWVTNYHVKLSVGKNFGTVVQ
jgi:hypothetical protein